MNKQSIIVLKIPVLFKILNEIKDSLGFDLYEFKKLNDLDIIDEKHYGNYLIISHKKVPDSLNMRSILLNGTPLKIIDLIEKININLLKNKFIHQSEIKIGRFKLDLNSRVISYNNIDLKLTEREIDIILYLNSSKKSQTIENLQKEVWKHGVDLETHTVKTHIYRLRKKIKEAFSDENFIISTEEGYKLS